MAKRDVEGAPKAAYSAKLAGMKFMQRGRAAPVAGKPAEVAAASEAQWTVNGGSRGCLVVSEGDPPPGAVTGRMSFHSFNPAAEKLQEELEEQLEQARDKGQAAQMEMEKAKDTAVSEADMAARLAAHREEVAQKLHPLRGGPKDGGGGKQGSSKKRKSGA